MTGVDRNAADRSQKRFQCRLVIKFLVDDVTNRSWTAELEDERVDPADVIGQKEKAAFGQMLEAERADAVKEFDERPAKKMECALTGGHVKHCLSFTINA